MEEAIIYSEQSLHYSLTFFIELGVRMDLLTLVTGSHKRPKFGHHLHTL